MPSTIRLLVAVVFSFFLVSNAFAHGVKYGDLLIDHPVIPATVKSAPVAAGYLTISNVGEKADRLVSFEADFTGKTSIHTMKMIDGVMKMRPLADGLEIPPGESVVLKKGGFHLMFMKLQEQMEAGQMRDVVLVFENAGRISIRMHVIDPADVNGEEMDHSDHSDHSGHSHSTN